MLAIVSADIVGYSGLMNADEEGTYARTQKLFEDVFQPRARQNDGRIFKSLGDGFLAEFSSTVRALEFALDILQDCSEHEDLRLRIGIHLGDVIAKDGDRFGDGVNVAARLQEAAEPGTILVSRAIRDQARDRFRFIDAGERRLKNIPRPARVFELTMGESTPPGPGKKKAGWRPSPRARVAVALAAAIALPIVVAGSLLLDGRGAGFEKPAIAVLPFKNLSGDPAQDYLSDGLSEDILTALSKFPELLVISRNSSFRYRETDADTQRIGTELGVGWILDGSVRRDADRVRVTAQLVDSATGVQRWAEKYDRDLEGMFQIEDEITETIVTTLVTRITKAEVERTQGKPAEVWEAYDFYLRAAERFRIATETRRAEDFQEVRRLIEAGLERDPRYAPLHALSAAARIPVYREPIIAEEWRKPETLDHIVQDAARAIEIDPLLPAAHAVFGTAVFLQGDTDRALQAYERALDLNPNMSLGIHADVLAYAGRGEEAVAAARKAMRVDPFFPPNYWFYLGHAQLIAGLPDEAMQSFRECDRRLEFRPCDMFLAAMLGHAGNTDGARHYAAEILRQEPGFRVGTSGQRTARQYSHRENATYLLEGLRLAGLPD